MGNSMTGKGIAKEKSIDAENTRTDLSGGENRNQDGEGQAAQNENQSGEETGKMKNRRRKKKKKVPASSHAQEPVGPAPSSGESSFQSSRSAGSVNVWAVKSHSPTPSPTGGKGACPGDGVSQPGESRETRVRSNNRQARGGYDVEEESVMAHPSDDDETLIADGVNYLDLDQIPLGNSSPPLPPLPGDEEAPPENIQLPPSDPAPVPPENIPLPLSDTGSVHPENTGLPPGEMTQVDPENIPLPPSETEPVRPEDVPHPPSEPEPVGPEDVAPQSGETEQTSPENAPPRPSEAEQTPPEDVPLPPSDPPEYDNEQTVARVDKEGSTSIQLAQQLGVEQQGRNSEKNHKSGNITPPTPSKLPTTPPRGILPLPRNFTPTYRDSEPIITSDSEGSPSPAPEGDSGESAFQGGADADAAAKMGANPPISSHSRTGKAAIQPRDPRVPARASRNDPNIDGRNPPLTTANDLTLATSRNSRSQSSVRQTAQNVPSAGSLLTNNAGQKRRREAKDSPDPTTPDFPGAPERHVMATGKKTHRRLPQKHRPSSRRLPKSQRPEHATGGTQSVPQPDIPPKSPSPKNMEVDSVEEHVTALGHNDADMEDNPQGDETANRTLPLVPVPLDSEASIPQPPPKTMEVDSAEEHVTALEHNDTDMEENPQGDESANRTLLLIPVPLDFEDSEMLATPTPDLDGGSDHGKEPSDQEMDDLDHEEKNLDCGKNTSDRVRGVSNNGKDGSGDALASRSGGGSDDDSRSGRDGRRGDGPDDATGDGPDHGSDDKKHERDTSATRISASKASAAEPVSAPGSDEPAATATNPVPAAPTKRGGVNPGNQNGGRFYHTMEDVLGINFTPRPEGPPEHEVVPSSAGDSPSTPKLSGRPTRVPEEDDLESLPDYVDEDEGEIPGATPWSDDPWHNAVSIYTYSIDRGQLAHPAAQISQKAQPARSASQSLPTPQLPTTLALGVHPVQPAAQLRQPHLRQTETDSSNENNTVKSQNPVYVKSAENQESQSSGQKQFSPQNLSSVPSAPLPEGPEHQFPSLEYGERREAQYWEPLRQKKPAIENLLKRKQSGIPVESGSIEGITNERYLGTLRGLQGVTEQWERAQPEPNRPICPDITTFSEVQRASGLEAMYHYYGRPDRSNQATGARTVAPTSWKSKRKRSPSFLPGAAYVNDGPPRQTRERGGSERPPNRTPERQTGLGAGKTVPKHIRPEVYEDTPSPRSRIPHTKLTREIIARVFPKRGLMRRMRTWASTQEKPTLSLRRNSMPGQNIVFLSEFPSLSRPGNRAKSPEPTRSGSETDENRGVASRDRPLPSIEESDRDNLNSRAEVPRRAAPRLKISAPKAGPSGPTATKKAALKTAAIIPSGPKTVVHPSPGGPGDGDSDDSEDSDSDSDGDSDRESSEDEDEDEDENEEEEEEEERNGKGDKEESEGDSDEGSDEEDESEDDVEPSPLPPPKKQVVSPPRGRTRARTRAAMTAGGKGDNAAPQPKTATGRAPGIPKKTTTPKTTGVAKTTAPKTAATTAKPKEGAANAEKPKNVTPTAEKLGRKPGPKKTIPTKRQAAPVDEERAGDLGHSELKAAQPAKRARKIADTKRANSSIPETQPRKKPTAVKVAQLQPKTTAHPKTASPKKRARESEQDPSSRKFGRPTRKE